MIGAGVPVSAAAMAGAIRESAMRNIVAAFAALRNRRERFMRISTRGIGEGIRFVVGWLIACRRIARDTTWQLSVDLPRRDPTGGKSLWYGYGISQNTIIFLCHVQ